MKIGTTPPCLSLRQQCRLAGGVRFEDTMTRENAKGNGSESAEGVECRRLCRKNEETCPFRLSSALTLYAHPARTQRGCGTTIQWLRPLFFLSTVFVTSSQLHAQFLNHSIAELHLDGIHFFVR